MACMNLQFEPKILEFHFEKISVSILEIYREIWNFWIKKTKIVHLIFKYVTIWYEKMVGIGIFQYICFVFIFFRVMSISAKLLKCFRIDPISYTKFQVFKFHSLDLFRVQKCRIRINFTVQKYVPVIASAPSLLPPSFTHLNRNCINFGDSSTRCFASARCILFFELDYVTGALNVRWKEHLMK